MENADVKTTKVKIACQFCSTVNSVDLARHAEHPRCRECKKPFWVDRPIRVTEDDFTRTVLEAPVPVLVDFYADWCGPCRMMSPALDEFANEAVGQALVVKVDTDKAPTLSKTYNIRSIPFLACFENGELVRSAAGVQSLANLRELVFSSGT